MAFSRAVCTIQQHVCFCNAESETADCSMQGITRSHQAIAGWTHRLVRGLWAAMLFLGHGSACILACPAYNAQFEVP